MQRGLVGSEMCIRDRVEIPTYQIGIFVFDLTFSIEKKCAKTCPKTCPQRQIQRNTIPPPPLKNNSVVSFIRGSSATSIINTPYKKKRYNNSRYTIGASRASPKMSNSVVDSAACNRSDIVQQCIALLYRRSPTHRRSYRYPASTKTLPLLLLPQSHQLGRVFAHFFSIENAQSKTKIPI